MENILKQAYQHQQNCQYDKAIELFLQLKENKQYYEIALMEIAKSYKMANNPIKAIDYFIELINYNNNKEEAVKELSQTACLSKQYDKAENIIKELFDKTSKNIYATELIKIYFYKKDIKQIENLISKSNLNKDYIYKILSTLQQKNNIDNKEVDKDINYYNKQIELDRNNYVLYLEKAKLERNEKNYSESMNDFNKSISINNVDPYVYMERGRLKIKIMDFEGAVKDFKKAIEINDKIYWFFLELARLQEELGNIEQYYFYLSKALEVLNIELVNNNDDIKLYIDKLFLQRYLGHSENIDSILIKIKELSTDTKIIKYIDRIQSVEKSRQTIAPYRCIFTWEMLYKCNYSCVYCLDRKNSKINDFYRSVDEIIDAWKYIYERYGESRIRLTGGEPSIYPKFLELVGKLSKYHKLQLGTNLSFDVNKFCDFTNPETIRVDASLHCEHTNLENFIKKLEILKQKKYKLSVSYVAYPDFIKNISVAKKTIENMNISFLVHPYSGYYNNKIYPTSYTDYEKKQLFDLDLKNSFEFNARKKRNNLEQQYYNNNNDRLLGLREKPYLKNKENNNYKKCRMGQMYARIYPNGNTYRCCYNDMCLGNLFDKTVKLLEQSEKCYDIDNCRCWRCMVPGEEPRWLHTWLDDWETEI